MDSTSTGNRRGFTVGAVGAERWEVEIEGRAAHAASIPRRASSPPDRGPGLADVLPLAAASGKVNKDGKSGTSTVGSSGIDGLSAGEATKTSSPTLVNIKGEIRSHNSRFVKVITLAYRQRVNKARRQVTDRQGPQGAQNWSSGHGKDTIPSASRRESRRQHAISPEGGRLHAAAAHQQRGLDATLARYSPRACRPFRRWPSTNIHTN